MLHDGAADGDAARASTKHRQVFGRGIALLDEVLRRSNHVVDGVLLGLLPPGIVPGFAELSAASRVHEGEHPPSLNPCQCARAKGRIYRSSISAIAFVKGWVRAIQCQAFLTEY